ncbi:right-handed parallel beta-helix repeat-containing protein [Ningiella sp. W23]|uniref:right-handed parallel beta-helix repeat-containing protein n=1 Tax=Ningiella sp. W23 TaxID=3023715 RepID=UPI003756EC43
MNTLFSASAVVAICVLIASITSIARANPACSSLNDQSANLRAMLDVDGVAEIPAGQTWRVDELELFDNEAILGKGTICKAASSTYGLIVKGNNVRIEDVTFRPEMVSGQPNCDVKLADGSRNVRIESNHFEGNTYSAICGANDTAVGGQPHVIPATGIMINDNTFNGYVRPIFLHSTDNVNIRNNILSNSLRDAIRLRENDGYVLISGNQFINVGNGVQSTETQDAIDTQWSGQRLVITDNIVRGTESIGFDIKGVSPDSSNLGSRSIIIANNHISDTFFSAIVLHGNLDTGEANFSIIVESNIIEGAVRNASFADAAIWAKGAVKYLTIANNQIRSNKARGITVQTRSGQSDGTVAGIHVTGNTLINNGVETAGSSIGLYLLGVHGAIVTGNTIGNDNELPNPSTRFGIYATKIVDGIFKNNFLRCNTSSQITVSGTNTIVSDNLQATTGCTP